MKNIVIILLVSFLITGCKKKVFDFRNKYEGDFHFTSKYYSWTINPYQQTPEVTEECDGKIYYNKEEEDGLIHIDFSNGRTFTLSISKDGELSACGAGGKFENRDLVNYSYSSGACAGSGMGGGSVFSFTGTRK